MENKPEKKEENVFIDKSMNRKSTRILEKKENKNVHKKEEKEKEIKNLHFELLRK